MGRLLPRPTDAGRGLQGHRREYSGPRTADHPPHGPRYPARARPDLRRCHHGHRLPSALLMDIFEELGVTAYINANEWYTSQGGSMLVAPVVQAMAEAPQRGVR